MREYLRKKFSVDEMGSSLTTELVAGLSVYLSLAYIFIVNPAILSQAKIPAGAVFFATVLISGLATLCMGFFARLPFALAPGLESNGFFTFIVVVALGFTWQQALGLVFWSGVLCLFFTYIPIRQKIIDSIPLGLKSAIAATVGVFVATIGLVITDVVTFSDGMPNSFSVSNNSKILLLAIGLIVTVALGLKRFNFPGGMLVSIIVAAVVAKSVGISSDTPSVRTDEFWSAFGELEIFGVFKDPRSWTILFIFFIIDFFGSIGKFIGLTETTNLYSEGKVKNMDKALYVDGGATSFGAVFGTSTIITFVESAVGIAAGGRTGLTAIVCGALMLLSLAFVPLVALVPVAATGGVLLYVGYLLFPLERIKSGELDYVDVFALISMALITLVTFSLDKALLIGFILYSGKALYNRQVNPYLIGATIILVISMGFQYFTF